MQAQKVALVILDGWGIAPPSAGNAVAIANTPVVDRLLNTYPHSQLRTDGLNVGLPDGQMGNSEVGHLNLGAGRVIYQELVKINLAVENGSLAANAVLLNALNYAKEQNKAVHFLGLVSDGCIHSSNKHLYALLNICKIHNVSNVFVHAFTDGRDTDPKSGLGFITELEEAMAASTGQLASVVGRYYAMDRDKRWQRVAEAYNLLVNGVGEKSTDLKAAIQASYNAGVTDEFIKPIVAVDNTGEPLATIQPNDVVICFNYRTDRCREITQVLTQQPMPEFGMNTLPLHYVTMTNYDSSFSGVEVIFENDNLHNTLGEVVANAGKTQLRIAETEKYPHVTFFFSGGREVEFTGESRVLVPSPKEVATYDLKPEMSAYQVADEAVKFISVNSPAFVCLNFANPDMVGHTGVFSAIVKAVEVVDECLGRVVDAAIAQGYALIVLADHGNAEFALNPDGTPNTAHTTNPVPCILVNSKNYSTINNGKLADVAPTILTIMGLPIPPEMDGTTLV